jgi:AraC-like DNA-binding protein
VGAIDCGKVVYEVAGQRESLRPGGLALVNPEVLHSCNPMGESRRSYFMLYLEKAWCVRLQQSLWEVDEFRPVRIALLEDRALYDQYLAVVKMFSAPGEMLEKEQHLADLLTSIFIKACTPGIPGDEPVRRVRELKNMLQKDLEQEITMERLARKLDANPFTLLRQFKASVGITPHAYRLNCRIDRARELLRQGRDIAETALECGFYDQSHLHRHFKAVTTVTPREYQVNFIQ